MRPMIGWKRPWAKDGLMDLTPLLQASGDSDGEPEGLAGLCAGLRPSAGLSTLEARVKKRLCFVRLLRMHTTACFTQV